MHMKGARPHTVSRVLTPMVDSGSRRLKASTWPQTAAAIIKVTFLSCTASEHVMANKRRACINHSPAMVSRHQHGSPGQHRLSYNHFPTNNFHNHFPTMTGHSIQYSVFSIQCCQRIYLFHLPHVPRSRFSTHLQTLHRNILITPRNMSPMHLSTHVKEVKER
jgi:hypothetical protein